MGLPVRYAGNQAQLGVAFQFPDAVYYFASGLFQPFGPFKIVLLIKSGTQFKQDSDCLAILCSQYEIL